LKILVTGSNGQLGSEFKHLSEKSPYEFIFTSRANLDISDIESVIRYFNQHHHFDFILNCAAYTAVDQAEDEKDLAYKINQDGVRNLATLCAQNNIKLVHFSTDYVFDGSKSTPYNEADDVSPQSIYGKSKLAGEKEIFEYDISALIIRTSWLYSKYGKNFVKSMIRLGREKESLNIVYDQIGTPTCAKDLAKVALDCISKHEKWDKQKKIYHFSNEGVCSWYDFALAIFDKHSIHCEIKPILSADYPTKAPRPHYSVLSKEKIKSDFGIKIGHWSQALKSVKF
jgi:dTDP-4-dehydrorhamnose reductase